MLTLLSLALADAPDTKAIQALASKAIGKEVPTKYLCIKRPQLGEWFKGDPTPVAIKKKNQGCVLRAIVVDGKWMDAEQALIVAVPGWASLDEPTREAVAIHWSRDVLLAYEQPLHAGEWSHGAVVTEVAHRVPKPQHASEGTVTLTFDKAGVVTRSVEEGKTYKTGMVLKANAVKGMAPEAAVQAIEAKGLRFKECVRAGWTRDLTVQGRTRLAWDVVEKKATAVTARGWGSQPLLQCYSNALGLVEFPADGHVDLTLAVTRTVTE